MERNAMNTHNIFKKRKVHWQKKGRKTLVSEARGMDTGGRMNAMRYLLLVRQATPGFIWWVMMGI